MGKISTVFSLRHLLVLSMALNVSLILRVVYEGDNEAIPRVSILKQGVSFMAAHRRQIYVSSPSSSTSVGGDDPDRVINLDHGDPTMYERFWRQVGDKATIVIPGWQSLSYFSDASKLCWFLEPEFAQQITRLHKIVGNAVTEDRYIVVGTGSTQLYQAVLYALSPQDAVEPMNVVSAAPFYSSYPLITDCVKSGIYKWAGDALIFDKEGPFIELVTSPNNPDGHTRESVVNRSGGVLVHDLAYYWPHYTPISAPANHDIMLFTVSKTTGHAGMRIGWALVKNRDIAKKMTKYIELNSIGVSKDSQLRAAKVLKVVSDACENSTNNAASLFHASLFHFGFYQMQERWRSLRAAAKESGLFSLPDFTPEFCRFFSWFSEPQPAFAWLKCEEPIEDCESFLRSNNILTRSGIHFGMSPQYVRISMLDRDKNFKLFVHRLSTIRLRQSVPADEG